MEIPSGTLPAGPSFACTQLGIIVWIWKKWAKLSLRAHQLLFRTVWADDLFTVWGGICFVIVSITVHTYDLFTSSGGKLFVSTCYEAAASHAFLAKGAQETLGSG